MLLSISLITPRLDNNDLKKIKSIANDEGILYQTLISSILHKYINNRFVDKNEVFNKYYWLPIAYAFRTPELVISIKLP